MKKFLSVLFFKRLLVYCAGLFVLALGVSFSKVANLGMSPLNSIPYVLSEVFTFLSMGTWVIIIFSLYILAQFVLLGKDLQPARLLQLFGTFIFGYFTDFTNWLTGLFLPNPDAIAGGGVLVYALRFLYLVIGMVLIALGILLYLEPRLVSLPGEGIVQVIAEKTHQPMPRIKVFFDITVSLIALVISLICFRDFHGIREGTLISAFCIGKILGLMMPLRKKVGAFLQ